VWPRRWIVLMVPTELLRSLRCEIDATPILVSESEQ
jgi:hypothetical protein